MGDSYAEVPVDAVDPETLWGTWEPVVWEIREVPPSEVAKLLLEVRKARDTDGYGCLYLVAVVAKGVWKDKDSLLEYIKAAERSGTGDELVRDAKKRYFGYIERVLMYSLQRRGRMTKAMPREE